jgi:hypothetical protein
VLSAALIYHQFDEMDAEDENKASWAKRKSRSLTATSNGMPGLLSAFDERKARAKE